MINRIKNIINLTKIFFQNSFQNPYLIDKKTNKLNKKSVKVWLLIIIMVAVTFLSYTLVKELVLIGQTNLFLNFMLLLLMIVLIFQVSLISTNVYYFSKDIELILPLPIKPVDLLIAKLNTIIINTYFFELIFILFPLIIYGIYISAGIWFYLYAGVLLLVFPVLPALIVSIIMMILMKLSKFIKNKDIFQLIITFLFVILVVIMIFNLVKTIIVPNNGEVITDEIKAVNKLNEFNNKLKNVNNYFLEINPSIELLNNSNKINSIINIFKIILTDLLFFIIFIFIGKITYLKDILKNNNFNTAKKIKRINLEKKCKKKNKIKSYINKEFKILFKSPIFFMQCIYPTLIMIVSLLIILIFSVPNIRALISSGVLGVEHFEIKLNMICIIVAAIQIIFTFSNTSITSVSREGKNAIFMKFIPIDYYKQIICKAVPQIIINLFFILILNVLIYMILPEIKLIYCIYIFIIANLLNIFNSLLMVVVDLSDPNLDWNAEYEVISQNNKKLYQYVFTIFIILLLAYFSKIFSELSINISCILIILILLFILIIFNLIINKLKIKLFKKIG